MIRTLLPKFTSNLSFTWLYLIFTSCFSLTVNAIEVNDLYQTKIEVEDQSYDSRKLAYQLALKEVFIRVTGNPQIEQISTIKKAIQRPVSYLNRYQYETLQDKLLLQVQFNETAVNKLIKQNNQTIWGKRRPLLLWWIVVDNQGHKHIVADGDAQPNTLIQLQSKKRGLPLLFPLMDFDDQTQLTLTDLWGRFQAPVLQASQRYNPDSVVMVRVFKQDNEQESVLANQWIAQLTLMEQGEPVTHVFKAEEQIELWSEMVDWLADYMAEKYSIRANSVSAEFLSLTVNNVNDAITAIKIQEFLDSISAVEKSQIQSVNPNGVSFKLKLLGEALDVLDALSLDNRIEIVKPKFGQEQPAIPNLYRWKG